jgi:hypothetical protein
MMLACLSIHAPTPLLVIERMSHEAKIVIKVQGYAV